MQPLRETSPSAYLYAIRELGRRAGAAPQWIERWRVRFDGDSVVVYLEPSSDVGISFPHEPDKPLRARDACKREPSRYQWLLPPHGEQRIVEDFVVPFEERPGDGSLFVTGAGGVACRADILTATLWMLARTEELVSNARDEHDRIPGESSIASRSATLERPIVDEYGLAFAQAIQAALPSWKPSFPTMRVKLSHDMDLIGIPPSVRTTVGHLYPRKAPAAFVRDLFSACGAGLPAYLQAAFDIAHTSHERGLDSAFYWTASNEPTTWDAGYDVAHPLVRRTIAALADANSEIGLHPAYQTFRSRERLDAEVARLRAIVGNGAIGGRQHYLRWEPSTWKAWEAAGLAYDSTVGYADAMGFRAGTALPYHPWLFDEDRESTLLEIPLLVMDRTPLAYMHLSDGETLDRIANLVRRCKVSGGVFTLLWHNNSIVEPRYRRLYPRILDLFAGAAGYRWERDLGIAPLPHVLDSLPPASPERLPRE
jgi:hypothetical protein